MDGRDIALEVSIQHEHVICLVCGKALQLLSQRHLAAHGLTPHTYKQYYKLPLTQPLCAGTLTQRRHQLAHTLGAVSLSNTMAHGRVLIVNADSAIGLVLTYALHQAQIEVDTAANGVSALDRMQAISVDVLLVDYHLPDMTGVELATAVRSLTPALPIALLTTSPHLVSAAALAAVGITRIFAKPFDLEDVLNWIQVQLP